MVAHPTEDLSNSLIETKVEVADKGRETNSNNHSLIE